jgi:hypothetical protein
MIQNLNLYSIALLSLSKFIHPNWLLYAPASLTVEGGKIGFDSKFVLIETTNVK